MVLADTVVGAGLVAAGAVTGLLTLTFPDTGERIGPAFAPRAVAGILIVLGAALAWQGLRRGRGARRSAPPRLHEGGRPAALVASCALYLWLLESAPALGFPLLTPPLLFLIGLLFGGRPTPGLAVSSILLAESSYLFFHVLLGLPLPRSAWF